jgi:hypothetical protein
MGNTLGRCVVMHDRDPAEAEALRSVRRRLSAAVGGGRRVVEDAQPGDNHAGSSRISVSCGCDLKNPVACE